MPQRKSDSQKRKDNPLAYGHKYHGQCPQCGKKPDSLHLDKVNKFFDEHVGKGNHEYRV